MTYVAVWAPRSLPHFPEIRSLLESGALTDWRLWAPCRVGEFRTRGDRYDGESMAFTLEVGQPELLDEPAERDERPDRPSFDERAGLQSIPQGSKYDDSDDGDAATLVEELYPDERWATGSKIDCRYNVVGVLSAELPDGWSPDTLLGLLDSLYRHVGRVEWGVLGAQFDADSIPTGTAIVDVDEMNKNLVFNQVCQDFIDQCVRRTRSFDPETDESEISDLVQRIEQADIAYGYSVDKWDNDDPELRQSIDYAKEIVGMLFTNIDIKSKKSRQRLITLLEIVVVLGTVLIIVIEGFRIATSLGWV